MVTDPQGEDPVGAAEPPREQRTRTWARLALRFLLRPPVLLFLVLCGFSVLTNGLLAETPRWGLDLAGGRLLPVGDLAGTWSEYLAAWHPVGGGTGSPAPPSLLVLALAGTVLAPLGGPPAAVALLVLFEAPLAGLAAYAAARRITTSPRRRVAAGLAYALLPAAAVSAAQGRLDVVVAHVLLPPVLVGIAAVLGLTGSGHWLGTACRTALGIAVLAAFAPLVHSVLLVLALVGFVVLPSGALSVRRRFAGVGLVVLLPVACLLPWPAVLFGEPGALLRGIGAQVGEPVAGAGVAALSPDGSAVSSAGALLVLAALAAAVLAPSRSMVPGAVVAGVGWVAAALVGSSGWSGGPLLLVAAGLIAVVLAAGTPRWSLPARVVPALVVAALLVLGVAAVLGGRSGPLRTSDGPVAEPGTVLVAEPGPQPAQWVPQRGLRFGDDALVPAPRAAAWLSGINADLFSQDRERVRGALAAAAAHGVDQVRVPANAAASLRSQAPDLVAEAGGTGGRADLRLLPPHTPVQLLGPDLARRARVVPNPPPEDRPLPVQAQLPSAAFRVSDGGSGRLLVLGAPNEPGWRASVDGREMPLATAWGEQVAVPLPEHASEVRVSYTAVPRTGLLAVQAAAVLFALVGSLPERLRGPRLDAGRPRSHLRQWGALFRRAGRRIRTWVARRAGRGGAASGPR